MSKAPKHLATRKPTRLGCGCLITPDRTIIEPCGRVEHTYRRALAIIEGSKESGERPRGEARRNLSTAEVSLATHVRQELAVLREADGDLELAATLSAARVTTRKPGATRQDAGPREPGAPKKGPRLAWTLGMDLGESS